MPPALRLDDHEGVPTWSVTNSVKGSGAVGAGRDVTGSALGRGSSTTNIGDVTISVGAPEARSQAGPRALRPPPIGEVADRRAIRRRVEEALLHVGPDGRRRYVFLEGYGGAGKSTVAAQVAQSTFALDNFGGNVIWVTVGQGRVDSALADLLSDMCDHLTGVRPMSANPLMTGAALGEILDDLGEALLVIDDVWTPAQVTPFLLGGAQCARLFTARNRWVAPIGSPIIEIGAMTEEEAKTAATAGLPPLSDEPVQGLLQAAKGWPVVLGLMNASLRDGVSAGGPPDEVAAWILGRIARDGPDALGTSSSPEQRTIAATIGASLALLTASERERYLELLLFRENSDIPDSMLAVLWTATGQLDLRDTSHLRARLAGLRLVSDRWGTGEPAIAVHDELRSYLKHQLSGSELRLKHQTFVGALRQLLPDREGTSWWQLPEHMDFAVEHLPYHLRQAGMIGELDAVAHDLRWVERQIRQLGSAVPAITTLADMTDGTSYALCSALRAGADVLLPERAPNALSATIVSRLASSDDLRPLVDSFVTQTGRPFLRSRWPLSDGLPIKTGHTGPVGDCALSDDGKYLVTASDDRLVLIWDATTLKVLRTLRGHRQRARACEFSPDGRRIVTAGMDGTVRIWDVEDGVLLLTLGDRRCRMLGCAWSPSGAHVASTASNGDVTVWDAVSGEALTTMHSPSGHEWDCSFGRTETDVVSCGEDGVVRIWDLLTGSLTGEILIHDGRIRACNHSPDGTRLATAGSDGTVAITDIRTSLVAHRLHGHGARVRSCSFSRDGTRLVTAAEDWTVRLWDVDSGLQLRSLEGHSDWVGGSVFSRDGTQIFSCGGDGSVRVWNITKGEASSTAHGDSRALGACAVSTDGALILTGATDGTLTASLLASAESVWTRKTHTGRILACAVGPQGIVTGGADGRVRLWDVATGALIRDFARHNGRVWGCAVSASQGRLASVGEDGQLALEGFGAFEPVVTLDCGTVHLLDCAFSPCGRSVAAVGDDGHLRVWDIDSATLLWSGNIGSETTLWACRFSPDGDLIAVVGEPAAAITFWSMSAREAVRSISVGVDRLTSISFSPCGRMLAACGDDAFLSVWDVRRGDLLCGVRVAFPLKDCAWVTDQPNTRIAAVGDGGAYLFDFLTHPSTPSQLAGYAELS